MLTVELTRKLSAGYRCLYLNSAPMVAGMRSYLAASGMDVASEVAKGNLVLSSDPANSANGFDGGALLLKLENALDQALAEGYKGLWATGDITWELGPDKDFSKLMAYEVGLEELFHRRPELSGLCQYHKDTIPPYALRQALLTHSSVFINETLTRLNPHYLQNESAPTARASNPELDGVVEALCRFDTKDDIQRTA